MPERLSELSTKKNRYHHGALGSALLKAVEQILRTRGMHALSLRAAARNARVSHSAPAHHFKNKAGLLTAFAVEGFERLTQVVGKAVSESKPRTGADLVEIMGGAYVRFALANPHHFAVMYRTDLLNLKDPEYRQASEQSVGTLRQAVNRCVREGLLPRRNAEEATAAFWSLGHGLVMLWFSGRLADHMPTMRGKNFAQRSISFFVRGMLVPASRNRGLKGSGVRARKSKPSAPR